MIACRDVGVEVRYERTLRGMVLRTLHALQGSVLRTLHALSQVEIGSLRDFRQEGAIRLRLTRGYALRALRTLHALTGKMVSTLATLQFGSRKRPRYLWQGQQREQYHLPTLRQLQCKVFHQSKLQFLHSPKRVDGPVAI